MSLRWKFLSHLRSFQKHCLTNLSSIYIIKKIRGTMEANQIPTFKLDSGHEIPCIGFGTYQMRGKECRDAVKWALEAGYTHIDTASIYKNEEDIRQVLIQMKVDRNKLFITSKIAPGEQGFDEAKQACDKMLNRLGTKYLDLLIIHWPGVSKQEVTSPKNSQIRRQTWRALVDLKKEGKARSIGVSNYLKHHLQDLMKHSDVKPAVNQFELHPLLWENSTIQFCREHNISIQAYSPLARADERLFGDKIVLSLSQKHKKTIAQICLRWSLQHNFIVLPKSKSKKRIVQNLNICDFILSEQDMQSMDELTKNGLRVCWNPNQITV